MKYQENAIYHIYNQGNNKQMIFFNHRHYLFFINKMIYHLHPYCDILAYCLMPNHFHWIIKVNKEGVQPSKALIPRYAANLDIIRPRQHTQQELSKQIGKLLSSYTQAVNRENQTTGSLFRSKTKAKHIQFDEELDTYFPICYEYVISNPVKAHLASIPESYPYSSVSIYMKNINDKMVNHKMVDDLLVCHT